MLGRRSVIVNGSMAAFAYCMAPPAAFADTGDASDFNSPSLPTLEVLGTQAATTKEVQVALDLLARCPTTSPLDAMTYFSRVTEKNAEGELYNAGWRTRWNPVIVNFFRKANLAPSGDVTPWCAASMNWVLDRCALKGTDSASSSSFRGAPGKTSQPKPGDIIVFRSADQHQADLGHGHVTLFVSQASDTVTCLGGNQVRAGHHAIMQQVIAKNGFLKLDSFHSIEAFKRA